MSFFQSFVFPANAAFVRLMVRSGGPLFLTNNGVSFLSQTEVVNLMRFRAFYGLLLEKLSRCFEDQAVFYHSPRHTAVHSLMVLFNPQKACPAEASLYGALSPKDIVYGSSKAINSMVPRQAMSYVLQNGLSRDFLVKRGLDAAAEYASFMCHAPELVAVALAHEPALSLHAYVSGVPEDQLGLNPGEGYLYFLNAERDLVSAVKVVPHPITIGNF